MSFTVVRVWSLFNMELKKTLFFVHFKLCSDTMAKYFTWTCNFEREMSYFYFTILIFKLRFFFQFLKENI